MTDLTISQAIRDIENVLVPRIVVLPDNEPEAEKKPVDVSSVKTRPKAKLTDLGIVED